MFFGVEISLKYAYQNFGDFPLKYLRDTARYQRHVGLTPSQLQLTRPEYGVYKAEKFKFIVYQIIRRQKYINYLQQKRAKQRKDIPDRPKMASPFM